MTAMRTIRRLVKDGLALLADAKVAEGLGDTAVARMQRSQALQRFAKADALARLHKPGVHCGTYAAVVGVRADGRLKVQFADRVLPLELAQVKDAEDA